MLQTQYFATFPAGCYEIIAKNLKSFKLEELKIIEHDESSVTFNSSFSQERLIELRFFTNIYLVIQDLAQLNKSDLKGDYFRLIMLSGGEPKALDASERTKIEADISAKLNLKANTHLSLNDFYLIERAKGAKFLGLRLSRAKFKREKLPAGELRPELAHILCLAGGIKAKDTILDVFAGYGSIPFEAVRGFGCKQVIAVDSQILPKRHEHATIKWHKGNARNLDFISSGSIARIVTDPPWGVYDNKTEQDLSLLYTDFTKEMQRVLKPSGVAVVITGWPQAERVVTQHLKLIAKWSVLVSGKKATIFKLQKT